jgi:hypothetical protein
LTFDILKHDPTLLSGFWLYVLKQSKINALHSFKNQKKKRLSLPDVLSNFADTFCLRSAALFATMPMLWHGSENSEMQTFTDPKSKPA